MEKAAQESFAIEYVKRIRSKAPGIGGLKLWYMYRRDFDGNNPVGRDRFAYIIDRYGLKVRKKFRKPKTTDSSHGLPTYPNIVKNLILPRANQMQTTKCKQSHTQERKGKIDNPKLCFF